MDEERFTVFFEDPFWVGVFERVEDGRLSVCKVMFGAQPKDTEIYAFICGQYRHLTFSTAVDADDRTVPVCPKRLKKKAKRDMERQGVLKTLAAAVIVTVFIVLAGMALGVAWL